MLHKTHIILALWAIGASVAVPLDGEPQHQQPLAVDPSSAPSVDAAAVPAQISSDVVAAGEAPASLTSEDAVAAGGAPAGAKSDLDTANTFWSGYGGYGGYGGYNRPYYGSGYGGGWRRGWGGYGGRGIGGGYGNYGGYGGYGGWAQPYWG